MDATGNKSQQAVGNLTNLVTPQFKVYISILPEPKAKSVSATQTSATVSIVTKHISTVSTSCNMSAVENSGKCPEM